MKKDLIVALGLASVLILTALAASFLRNNGYIEPDTMLRVVAMNGLIVAYYGNRAPKTWSPSAAARQIARFSGWSFVISGLVYAGFWAFAPLPLAMTIGTGAVAAGLIATLVYCFKLKSRVAAD